MRRWHRWSVVLAGALAAACSGTGGAEGDAAGNPYTPPDVEPPVAVNAESPIQYPAALYARQVEGVVVLRLFVDSVGKLVPESTRVAETSNHPALDSAARAGAATLRFAPARRRGVPVATVFLQPVEFRYPEQGTRRGAP